MSNISQEIPNAIYVGAGSKTLTTENKKKLIREYLFSINQPVVFRENGQRIAEYKDGRKEIIR